MNFTVTRNERAHDIQVVTIGGQLDAHSYHLLKDELLGLQQEGTTKIVLDCAELDYISSAGLGVLKHMRKELRSSGGDLRLARLPEKIDNILNLLGFSKIMQSFRSNAEAIASFEAHS